MTAMHVFGSVTNEVRFGMIRPWLEVSSKVRLRMDNKPWCRFFLPLTRFSLHFHANAKASMSGNK